MKARPNPRDRRMDFPNFDPLGLHRQRTWVRPCLESERYTSPTVGPQLRLLVKLEDEAMKLVPFDQAMIEGRGKSSACWQ